MHRIQLPTLIGRTIVAAAVSFVVNIGTAHAVTITENFDSGFLSGWSTTGSFLGGADKYAELTGNKTLTFGFYLSNAALVNFSFWYSAFLPGPTDGDVFNLMLGTFSDNVGRTNTASNTPADFSGLNPGPGTPSSLDVQYPGSGSIFLNEGMHSLTFTNLGSPGASSFDDFTMNVTAVPEPGSWAMLLAGLGAMGVVGRRRRVQD
jgi:hypothetical protein